jgi:hypothetical protein
MDKRMQTSLQQADIKPHERVVAIPAYFGGPVFNFWRLCQVF